MIETLSQIVSIAFTVLCTLGLIVSVVFSLSASANVQKHDELIWLLWAILFAIVIFA